MGLKLHHQCPLTKLGAWEWIPRLLQLCEQSGAATPERGWLPYHFTDERHLSSAYLKSHSWGEFIFDWSWAQLAERWGRPYYPKLVHALPFTPINVPKILGEGDPTDFIQQIKEHLQALEEVHSHHWLFTTAAENQALQEQGYFIQKTWQYHWINRWESFEHFLAELKQRKRKMIKKERERVREADLRLEMVPTGEVPAEDWPRLYELYVSTIERKHSHAYLKSGFFTRWREFLSAEGVVARAYRGAECVAMALFLQSKSTLYGRYWGIDPRYQQELSFLHFELCLYQGMEWCFRHGLTLFEAGAQGEHKLLRGFRPVTITSAHALKDRKLHELIARHIRESNRQVEEQRRELCRYLPFKAPQLAP